MSTELLQQIVFGRDGDDTGHLGDGWSEAETGYRWATGLQSEIWLDHPGPGDGFLLELQLIPFRVPPSLTAQRLAVEVRGTVIGRSVVDTHRTLGYRIPANLLAAKGPVRVILHHGDAVRPSEFGIDDQRILALCLYRLNFYSVSGEVEQVGMEGGGGISLDDMQRLTGLPTPQFMQRFESLGDNCEFGLVQRRCGAEPTSLLRFSNLELPDLLRGLQTRFDGIGAREQLELSLSGDINREYIIREKKFGLTSHTWLREGEVDAGRLVAQQTRRLKFLARKLVEDLIDGRKIFVYKRNIPLTEAEILPLYIVLNKYASNTLLWVAPADADHRPGSVDSVLPGLVKGYIDRFAPYEDAHDLTFEVWLELCVNADRLAATRAIWDTA